MLKIQNIKFAGRQVSFGEGVLEFDADGIAVLSDEQSGRYNELLKLAGFSVPEDEVDPTGDEGARQSEDEPIDPTDPEDKEESQDEEDEESIEDKEESQDEEDEESTEELTEESLSALTVRQLDEIMEDNKIVSDAKKKAEKVSAILNWYHGKN